jgi:hypothetical protein
VEERGKNTELRELRLDLVCATNRDSAWAMNIHMKNLVWPTWGGRWGWRYKLGTRRGNKMSMQWLKIENINIALKEDDCISGRCLFNRRWIESVDLQLCCPTSVSLYGISILTDSVCSELQSLTVCFWFECVFRLSFRSALR